MRTFRLIGFVLALSAVLQASVLRAEVMDKEPTRGEVWAWSIAGAVLGFALTRARWWLLLVALPITLFIPARFVFECHDALVGPAIREEAGSGYVLQVHAGFLLVLLGNAAGTVLSLRLKSLSRHGTPSRTGV